MSRKTISFVLPVYNEAEMLQQFYSALCGSIKKLEERYALELIFIDDGSSDDTAPILAKIAAADTRVKTIGFSRNFGHQIAITAGIDFARGDAVIVMDTDLQDPPAVALELVREWENGSEVVYAVRKTRKDGVWKKATASLFYKLMARLSDFPIPQNTGDFRLLDAKAAAAMRQYRELHRFMRGIAAHIGFKQKAVLFDRDERKAGQTHYPFKKMLKLSLDAVLSFSNVPLRAMGRIGFLISAASALGGIYMVILHTFFPSNTIQGWTSLVVLVLFLSGIQCIMLGTIGEYVGRIYAESKGRPLYIVSTTHGIIER